MTNKVSFLTQNFGKYDPHSIDSYLKIGGFSSGVETRFTS